MILVCHVVLQDHVTKTPGNFMGRSPSSHHPAKFGGHNHSGSGDIVLVCHVILQDHITKRSYDFIGGSPS